LLTERVSNWLPTVTRTVVFCFAFVHAAASHHIQILVNQHIRKVPYGPQPVASPSTMMYTSSTSANIRRTITFALMVGGNHSCAG
jgi:hypothetical protein